MLSFSSGSRAALGDELAERVLLLLLKEGLPKNELLLLLRMLLLSLKACLSPCTKDGWKGEMLRGEGEKKFDATGEDEDKNEL